MTHVLLCAKYGSTLLVFTWIIYGKATPKAQALKDEAPKIEAFKAEALKAKALGVEDLEVKAHKVA